MWSVGLDIAVVVIVIFSAVRGYMRGFIKTLSGIVIFVLAIAGAAMLARVASPVVGEWIRPTIEEAVGLQVGTEAVEASLNDVAVAGVRLGDFDFYADVVGSAGDGVDSAISAVAAGVASGVAYWVCAIAGFILLLILLTLAAKALNAVFRLPVLNFMNKSLGLLAGLVFGLLAVFIAAQILGFFTGLVPHEAQENTMVYKYIQEPGRIYTLVD